MPTVDQINEVLEMRRRDLEEEMMQHRDVGDFEEHDEAHIRHNEVVIIQHYIEKLIG